MLGDKLREIFDKLSGRGYISSEILDEVSKDVQKALIVSDVNIKLVLEISNKIKALKGEEVPQGISEKDFIVKRIYDTLSTLFGSSSPVTQNPKRILLVGLYGSGKTTTAGKLANYYRKKGKSVGLIAADTYRMAAREQLKQYAEGFDVFTTDDNNPSKVVQSVLNDIKKDVIIVDSAGRSSFDEELSLELKGISDSFRPDLVILVMPADIGQIALKLSEEFNKTVKIDGIILTRMDGSAKGGGALAACSQLKIPVLFTGSGEKITDLDVFDSQRYLSSIMGYGDLTGLFEKISDLEVDESDFDTFDFVAMKKQLKMTKSLGSIGKIAGMLGFGKMLNNDTQKLAEKQFDTFNYIIDSMTVKERKNPDLIDGSRIKRIAKGSGTTENDVRLLIKQHKTMRGAMDTFKGKDIKDFKEQDVQGIFKKQLEKKARRKFRLR